MANEILMRGATPIAMPQPVEAPVAPTPAGPDGFSKALLAELDGPAPAASQGLGAPSLAPPKAITLDTIPVAPPVMVAPPPPPAAAGNTYTVQAGDSLSKIARKLGNGNWSKLYAANKGVVGADPNKIHPGQVLTLPAGWQAAGVSKVAHAPTVQAAVEPAARAAVAGTPPAQVPTAPIMAPPSLPVEAAHEADPATVGTVAAPEAAPTAAIVGVASEAIDRLTTEPGGGQDHVATLREALNSIPPGHASYAGYKAKVEAYEAAVGAAAPAAGPAPAAPAPAAVEAPSGAVETSSLDQPPMGQPPVDAAPPAIDAMAPMATPPMAAPSLTAPSMAAPPPVEAAFGPGAPAGATIDAQVTQPAVPVVAPAEDAGDASPDGEEGWQAFS